MNDIPVLADVVPKTAVLEGQKMSLSDILNIPLVFTGWTFGSSKFKPDGGGSQCMERMTLQFDLDGQKRIVFTSSEVLISQVRDFMRLMPEATCFKATIKRIDGKFLKFVGGGDNMQRKNELVVRIDADAERGDVYTLVRPVRRYGLDIPAGFQSDGASVPRFFWRCVFPPGDVHALGAAFLHDFIYRTHPVGWTREAADKLFLDTLIEDGVPKRRAFLAYIGVRLFGASAWREGGKTK